MKQAPGRSACAPLISVALATRMFWGLSIDYPYALNALWMCPLVGLVFALPLVFAIDRAGKLGNGSPLENLCGRAPRGAMAAFGALFALPLIWDAAASVRLTASSSNIIALNNATIFGLSLPLALCVFAVVLLGMEATGFSARIWLKFLPLLLLIVILVQLRSYNVAWLAPILGDGAASILDGGVYCAGCMALLSLPWMVAVPDRNCHSLLRYIAFPALATVALLVAQQMLCPVQLRSALTRAARIEFLLGNGRIHLSPQMAVNGLWYGSLLHLMSAESTAASAFLARAFPRVPTWVWAALIATLILVLVTWNPLWLKQYLQWMGVTFVSIAAVLALLMLLALTGKGGRDTCENGNG